MVKLQHEAFCWRKNIFRNLHLVRGPRNILWSVDCHGKSKLTLQRYSESRRSLFEKWSEKRFIGLYFLHFYIMYYAIMTYGDIFAFSSQIYHFGGIIKPYTHFFSIISRYEKALQSDSCPGGVKVRASIQRIKL